MNSSHSSRVEGEPLAAHYVLTNSKDGQVMFNLKAANGQIILTSERYTTKSAAENGIESVRKNSPLDERYGRRENSKGEPYFILKAANSQAIGRSEYYSSASAMENGVESVKTNGPNASVVDETE
jgi:uncharacterized protein